MIDLAGLNDDVKLILTGSIWIVVCCVFYLMWWLMAFKPEGVVTGMKTDWLLLPALAAGAFGVLMELRGIWLIAPDQGSRLFPGGAIIIGGIAAYVILLVVTLLILKRPVTTELFLIVGWGMLALSAINALYAAGSFSHGLSIVFVVIIFAIIAISLILYALYFRMEGASGYIGGMIPLLLVIAVTIAISFCIVFSGK